MSPTTAPQLSLVSHLPLDGPFAIEAAFCSDKNEKKVNLTLGVYRDGEGNPYLLSAVKEAKKRMNLDSSTHEYTSLLGNLEFLEESKRVLFGLDVDQGPTRSIASIQTVSGTGANSLISRFVREHLKATNVWLPDPSWENHLRIWRHNAPGVIQRRYPYYNSSSRAFDFAGMTSVLRNEALPGDAILLHACAHNPTGLDPSKDQWREIASLCQEKQLFVLFDVAYQGFASSDLDQDSWPVRFFISYSNIEFAACQSFSKNLGLYGERVGALHIVPSRAELPTSIAAIESQLVELQRADISMAPRFGAQIAELVLSDPELKSLWKRDLFVMTGRIRDMRLALHDKLVKLDTKHDWSHLLKQSGMFSYTGLSEEEVECLRKDFSIYLLRSGRVSICGLRATNVEYVAQAISEVVCRHDKN